MLPSHTDCTENLFTWLLFIFVLSEVSVLTFLTISLVRGESPQWPGVRGMVPSVVCLGGGGDSNGWDPVEAPGRWGRVLRGLGVTTLTLSPGSRCLIALHLCPMMWPSAVAQAVRPSHRGRYTLMHFIRNLIRYLIKARWIFLAHPF